MPFKCVERYENGLRGICQPGAPKSLSISIKANICERERSVNYRVSFGIQQNGVASFKPYRTRKTNNKRHTNGETEAAKEVALLIPAAYCCVSAVSMCGIYGYTGAGEPNLNVKWFGERNVLAGYISCGLCVSVQCFFPQDSNVIMMKNEFILWIMSALCPGIRACRFSEGFRC